VSSSYSRNKNIVVITLQAPDFRIYEAYYRNGSSHRDGADVNFQDIVKTFGFPTVTVGKWVTALDQRSFLNNFGMIVHRESSS
jgi:hypothetical protein